MANMNFGVNILPKTNNIYSLGNSDYKWNIFVNQINGTDVSSVLNYYDALPAAPQTDGNALVSVNGEWVPQSGYGYTKLDDVLTETSITVPPNQTFYVHVINGIGASVNADPIYVYYDGVEYVLERHEMQSGGVMLYIYGNSTFSPSDAKFVINAIQQAGAPIQIGFNQSESGATHTMQIRQGVLTLIDNKYIDVPVKYGTGTVSTVEGASNTASGYGSHVEGVSNTASGSYTHAEGFYTTAAGFAAHAEGYQNSVTGDNGSHAEGYDNAAVGESSHAEGIWNSANGKASHAEGFYGIANGAFSHVSGQYNIADSYANWDEWVASTSYVAGAKVKRTTTSDGVTTVNGYVCVTPNSDSTFDSTKWRDCNGAMNYAEIVGNGTDNNNRSNARTLDWNGNGWYAGKVSVGTSSNPPVPTAANDLTTKQYVDTHALPAASQTNGEALVSVNGEWTKQAGYGYTSTTSVLSETEITIPSGTTFYVYTAEGIGSSLNTETISVMFDDVEYVLPRHNDSYGYVYGDESFGYHQSSEYPVEILAPQQEGAPAYIGFNETGTGNTHTISISASTFAHIDNKYINLPIKPGTGTNSAVVGNTTSNTASGSASYAEGYDCHAQGNYSHSEGYESYATGVVSHSEGYENYAVGDYSHAEGYTSYAYDYAHAEGSSTARGAVSHAEGNTVANGAYSHTSGYHNIPDSYSDWDEWTANTSYAVGDKVKRTITSSGTTTVYGYICKTANSDSTFLVGNWIDCNGKMNYIEIVGNAMTSNTYSNARTLDWNGNGWYAGKVSVGTLANPPVPTANNDLTTKQYVDAHALPAVTAADNGKIPRVVNGAWALTTIASANGVSF